MGSHQLAEKTTGLASRVNNLAVGTTGPDSRRLREQEDELAKLSLVAITKDLNAEDPLYQEAVASIERANITVEQAEVKIDQVAQAIELVAQAITRVRAVLV